MIRRESYATDVVRGSNCQRSNGGLNRALTINASNRRTRAMSPRKHSCVATSIMANEIDLAVKSGRVRAASYEELYGSPRRTAPEPAGTDERSHRLRNILAIGSAVAFAMVLVGQRERIVKHAPAMATAYATIGLPVNT